jgi:hypothetical protein
MFEAGVTRLLGFEVGLYFVGSSELVKDIVLELVFVRDAGDFASTRCPASSTFGLVFLRLVDQ